MATWTAGERAVPWLWVGWTMKARWLAAPGETSKVLLVAPVTPEALADSA